jgi:hypothetical protein
MPTGLLAAATATYTYSDARRFVRGVSAEQGQALSLSLRVSDPALGSAFSFWQLSATAQKYLALPFTWQGRPLHHALALRASGGVARGDLSDRHLFYLGGFQQGDPVRAVLSPQSAPLRILRGYSTDAFSGDKFVLGTGEYRLPLWNIEQGAWTLPFMLRRLHAAAFGDLGDAWTAARDFRLHGSLGAELRAEVVIGYVLPTDVRFGCARGLEAARPDGQGAILDCYAALGGVF